MSNAGSDADARKWPPFFYVVKILCDEPDTAEEAGTFVSGDDFTSPTWDEGCENGPTTYIHRDVARAWQALRDFLDGTPEYWRALFFMGTD